MEHSMLSRSPTRLGIRAGGLDTKIVLDKFRAVTDSILSRTDRARIEDAVMDIGQQSVRRNAEQRYCHRGKIDVSDILDQVDNNVLTITLNRPDEGNGLNDQSIGQLTTLLQSAAARARLVVLKGAGKDFASAAVAPRGAAQPKLEALQVRKGRDVVFNCYSAFRDSPIPIIAAVNGRAPRFRFRNRVLRRHDDCARQRNFSDAGVRREHHADDRDVRVCSAKCPQNV
jgi:hypothetical protein